MAPRCEVLKKEILKKAKKGKEGKVVVEVGEKWGEVFERLLEFLYTDHTQISPESNISLMLCAAHYGVTRLVSLCEVSGQKQTKTDTTCQNTPTHIITHKSTETPHPFCSLHLPHSFSLSCTFRKRLKKKQRMISSNLPSVWWISFIRRNQRELNSWRTFVCIFCV